jgi:predicted acetyltransferase
MSEIRVLSADEFGAFARITVDAYPGMVTASEEKVKERMLKVHQEEPTVAFYGLFREGQLLGGMRLHDFEMNLFGTRVAAGGVGSIAVDLVHKKEHVAKEIVSYFIRHYRERGAPIALLYPFRPDFYKKMGFGYGTKMNQYRVKPAALPKGPSRAHVRYLDQDDRDAVRDCHNRFLDRTHGLIVKSAYELKGLMESSKHRILGYERDGQILGYLAFSFSKGDSALLSDVHVRELVYESREALSELMTFLHVQADQIRHVIFDTQDEYFHHLLLDPRNDSPELIWQVCHPSNVQAVGIMYRVIDTRGIFDALKERNFGGQTCRVKLTIEDSFVPENAGSTLLYFDDGRLHLPDGGVHEVEVRMDVAEFSSLLVGVVDFTSLYRYGLADVSDPGYVGIVDRIFAARDKPVCTTPF